MTWVEVCAAVHAALPGVEVSSSYGTPALKVRGKMLVRVWPDEPDVLVVRLTDLDEQEELTATEPETFFITPHYAGYAAVLVRLGGIEAGELAELVTPAWRGYASKALLAELDAR